MKLMLALLGLLFVTLSPSQSAMAHKGNNDVRAVLAQDGGINVIVQESPGDKITVVRATIRRDSTDIVWRGDFSFPGTNEYQFGIPQEVVEEYGIHNLWIQVTDDQEPAAVFSTWSIDIEDLVTGEYISLTKMYEDYMGGVGGIGELPEIEGAPLQAAEPSTTNQTLLMALASAGAFGALALAGATWYAWRRRMR